MNDEIPADNKRQVFGIVLELKVLLSITCIGSLGYFVFRVLDNT